MKRVSHDTSFDRAVEKVTEDKWDVCHVFDELVPHRAAAVRFNSAGHADVTEGTFDITLSDGRAEVTQEYRGLTLKQADRLIKSFMRGVRGGKQTAWLHINQAERYCEVVKTTPTRVRIEYEMPNAGLMGGWQYYADCGRFRYYSYY